MLTADEIKREARAILWEWAAKTRLGLADEACTRQVADELCALCRLTTPEARQEMFEDLLEAQAKARRRLQN